MQYLYSGRIEKKFNSDDSSFYKHDGAPPHYSVMVNKYLDVLVSSGIATLKWRYKLEWQKHFSWIDHRPTPACYTFQLTATRRRMLYMVYVTLWHCYLVVKTKKKIFKKAQLKRTSDTCRKRLNVIKQCKL